MLRTLLFLVTLSLVGPSLGEEPKEIPLKDVWAYRMPGTRTLTDATRDGEYVSEEGPLIRDIRKALKYRGDKPTGPAFVVPETGRDALPKVREVLRSYLVQDKATDAQPLPSGEELTLAFFAYQSGAYVHLEKVEVVGNTINVRYRFVRHATTNLSEHVALIPLGTLEPGDYSVNIVRTTKDALNDEVEWAKRLIAKSFTFNVSPNLD